MINWGDPATWTASIVAILSLILAIRAGRKADKAASDAQVLAERNSKLLEDQTRLNHQAWADNYYRSVTAWGDKAALNISRALHLCMSDNPPQNEVREVRANLSAAIDVGRWFFPNYMHDDYGLQKPPAYRGYRQNILNWLVRAYDVFSHPDQFEGKHELLVEAQRHFVSEMQVALDPRTRDKKMQSVLAAYKDVGVVSIGKPPEVVGR